MLDWTAVTSEWPVAEPPSPMTMLTILLISLLTLTFIRNRP